jgi:glutamate dehydrogenase
MLSPLRSQAATLAIARRSLCSRKEGPISADGATLVRDKLGPDKAGPAEEFVRRYYANVALDDLRRETVETLCGQALAIWGFAARRDPGTARLRVYNPSLEDTGWQSSRTVIEIVNDDMPFLVDSVTGEMNRRDLTVQLVVHPIVRVRRDAGGRLAGLVAGEEAPEGALSESFMHIEIAEQPPEAHEELRAALDKVISAIRVVVGDWHLMRARVDEIIAELDAAPPPVPETELAEVRAFLEWIRENHFTFLGARAYDLVLEEDGYHHRPVAGSGLGQLREISPESAARHAAPLSPPVAEFARRQELLILAKTDTRSIVHRPVPLDFIGVRRFGDEGEIIGEHRILGLYSSTAYNESPRYIPVLREKVERTIARAGFSPTSHDGKVLLHILETFPRDELFQIPEDELYATALGVLQLQERQRVALFVRCDPFGRHVSCLVFAPRERYGTDLVVLHPSRRRALGAHPFHHHHRRRGDPGL